MILGVTIAIIVVLLTAVFRYKRRRITHPHENSYVVITGCDSGFGRLAAERFDSYGMTVFAGCLLEKSITELNDTCSRKICPVILDVTKQDDIENLLSTLNSKLPVGIGLTGLINNAGVLGAFGLIDSLGSEQYLSVFRINFFAMIDVTKALLPLIRKGQGRIINISSYAGKFAGPYVAPYYASKHAVESFSDSLRRELYHDSVSVHMVEPGTFKTSILNTKKVEEDFKNYYSKMSTESKDFYGMDMLNKLCKYFVTAEASLDPKLSKVVNAYEHALTSAYPKNRYIVGIDSRILITMAHYFPEWLTDFIIASQFPIPAGVNKS